METGWHWVSCLEKRPEERSVEDVDIICFKLKTLKVFDKYPEDVLRELSKFALYNSFLGNVTLFRPGDEGLYWYTVISGQLEVLDVDAEDSSKTNSICMLREGDSFGESAIFGTVRQTMTVTVDFTELLCVESQHIRKIYEDHRRIMSKLLKVTADQSGSLPPLPEEQHDGSDSESLCENELWLAGVTLVQLIKEHFSFLMTDHRVNMFTYKQSCSGRGLVDWALSQSNITRPRQQVIGMWQALLSEGILQHVHGQHPFKDDAQIYYRFVEQRRKTPHAQGCSVSSPKPKQRPFSLPTTTTSSESGGSHTATTDLSSTADRSSRSSFASLLDECFDTIVHLGPEALLYATLLKSPAERTEEDLDNIFEELQNVRAFGHLSNAVKRELAACVLLEHHQKAGKFLFRQGDEGDCWYIVLRGSVSVHIRGKGVVCTLHEGDDFGKLATVNKGVRSASVQVQEKNSYFLRVERQDFKRILFSVESSTLKFEEHGKEVLLLEKAGQGRYNVVKGTPTKMLEHLLDEEVELEKTDTFVHDYFLTHPAFISVSDLCEAIMRHFKSTDTAGKGTKEMKKKVAAVVSLWVQVARAELVKTPAFLELFKELQDRLPKDGLVQELKMLSEAVTSSMRQQVQQQNQPLSSSHGSPLPAFKFSKKTDPEIKIGINTLPPCQPQDRVPTRVHTVENTCCRLQVRLDSTAQGVAEEAMKKLGLRVDECSLCEVKSSGEKIMFKPSDVSVCSEMSVNGRLFIIPKEFPNKTLPPLPDQNTKPVTHLSDKDSAREIAAHLTVYDWNLFTNIQQMELIYQIFGRHKFGKIITNLDLLIRRFNEVQYWVVTELCSEPDLTKRAALLRKFIKIAGYCKADNNLNSFFAIVVGLMNGAVTRLKQTWKELPPKFRRRIETFESLMDPSRNHRVLRAYQSKLQPPVIPFMPLLMKDAYFLHEGSPTYIDDLVNFEKMRLVSSKVRNLGNIRSGVFPQEIKMIANKNPSLQLYIRSLKVIDNEHVLTQMSHKVEATVRPQSSVQ